VERRCLGDRGVERTRLRLLDRDPSARDNTEADDPDEWDEYTFAELVFFLRAWSGSDPARAIEVLEERPVTLHDDLGSQVA